MSKESGDKKLCSSGKKPAQCKEKHRTGWEGNFEQAFSGRNQAMKVQSKQKKNIKDNKKLLDILKSSLESKVNVLYEQNIRNKVIAKTN